MLVKSLTKYDNEGKAIWTETISVFDVEDKGNGIARGQIACSKKPYDKSKADQALINAGLKLDNKGYMKEKSFVVFRGAAYEKALGLSNGAIIQDFIMDIDWYPYVNKNNEIEYRKSAQQIITDFEVKLDNGGKQQETTDTPQPQTTVTVEDEKPNNPEDDEYGF